MFFTATAGAAAVDAATAAVAMLPWVFVVCLSLYSNVNKDDRKCFDGVQGRNTWIFSHF